MNDPTPNTIDYWKQVAKDAIDARDRMTERQRATVAECERLRHERDKAVRDVGMYQEQFRNTFPNISDLIEQASEGRFSITFAVTINQKQDRK